MEQITMGSVEGYSDYYIKKKFDILFTSFYCQKRNSKELLRDYKNSRFQVIPDKKTNKDISHFIIFNDQHYLYAILDKNMIDKIIYDDFESEEEQAKLYNNIYHQIYIQLMKCVKEDSFFIIEDWIPYIVNKALLPSYCLNLKQYIGAVSTENSDYSFYYSEDCHQRVIPFSAKSSYFIKNSIMYAIDQGLKNGEIYINIPKKNAETIDDNNINNIYTVREYIAKYSDQLIQKIAQAYVPLFNPQQENYSSEVKKYSLFTKQRRGIDLLQNQKNVIEACVRRLKKQHSVLICGSMGVGKTAMGIGVVQSHFKNSTKNKKKYSTNIVLCPGHLVEKWKREIESLYPCSEAIICKDTSDFILNIEKKINDEWRRHHLFIIINKDSVKSSYELAPALNYSESKKVLRCPECGHVVKNLRKSGYRFTNYEGIIIDYSSFINDACKCYYCKRHPKFTQPYNPKISLWEKIPKTNYFIYKKTKNDFPDYQILKTKFGVKVAEYLEYQKSGLGTKERMPKLTVSLGEYIHKKCKHKIDYLIVDEAHQYSGDTTLQGKLFSQLVKSSNKTVALTGTLINGYCSNIFYLLFRLFSKEMLKNGYRYNSIKSFVNKYGYEEVNTNTGKKKEAPGISPAIFTDILIGSCAFISMDYKTEYSEIPVGVLISDELNTSYNKINKVISNEIKKIKNNPEDRESNKKQRLFLLVNALQNYLDMPYNLDTLRYLNINIDKLKLSEDVLYPKEEKLLELVDMAIKKNEHILIYTYWTNKTDTQNRLYSILEKQGYKVDILSSDIKNKDRERWIKEKTKNGIQIIICNPSLVETGLDLLDFTTIIFYQMGYNLTTMRQASKRSYRLNQINPVHVYFLYYEASIQEVILSVMAAKLQAATTVEGDYSSEGLKGMNGSTDIVSILAKSIVEDNKINIDKTKFQQIDTEYTIKKDSGNEKQYYIEPFSEDLFFKKHKRKIENKHINVMQLAW